MIVPVLQVFGGSLGGTDTARTYAEATMLARSKLTEVAAAESFEEGEESGSFEGSRFRWRSTVARDTSEVTLPDNTVVGAAVPRRSRSGFGRDAAGSGQSGFASRSGSSGFGAGSSGFGSGSRTSGGSGLGQSKSGFGSGGSGAGGSTTKRPGAAGTASTTGTAGSATSGDDIEGDITAALVPYRVTVTVEWGQGRSGGETSLSTERIAREAAPVSEGNR